MQDNIHNDSLLKLAAGISKCAAIVNKTMGPKGSNVLIQHKLAPGHILTNDGATIINSMEFEDPIENMGLGFVKEAAQRSNQNSGDGSSTMTCVLDGIVKEGIKAEINSLEIKKSLDDCLPIIEKSIHEQTKQITVEDIPAVARIAGENEELAETLGTIYRTIGKEGIIHLEGSGSYDTSYTLIEGVRFGGTGYLSPYMAYDEEAKKAGRKETKAIYQKPSILVTKNKISRLDDINPLLSALIAKEVKTLVIFTDDMDSNVARALIELQKSEKRAINILIIKAPVLWKGYVFEDFAKITGSTIIEDSAGISFKNLKLEHLGTCDTIVVDKDECTVIGIADISDHIEELKKENTTDANLRLSWLTTKTAILKLGAKSETELSYLRLKAEDAVHSSRLALQSGIVAGGGLALLNASLGLPETVGGKILTVALQEPMRQIMRNAGNKASWDNGTRPFIGFDVLIPERNKGFDANSGRVVDMFEAGIVDASAVVLGAIRNSLGIASTLLTTSSVITLPPPSQEELLDKSMRPMGF